MSSKALLMEFAALSRSLGARHIGFSAEKGFTSVSIDSRTVREGALFIALSGQNTDGHGHVRAAFEAGAQAVMAASSKLEQFDLQRTAESLGKDLIVVDDTLKGFQQAARVYLDGFPNLIRIGITGSSGKTTSKEICAAITSREKNTVSNQGNLNSEIGLPLSVFNVRSCHELGIFEIAMNRRNEIAELTDIVKPDIAAITNIGNAHVGLLGSKQAIAGEKKSIFSRFTGSELALIPADDEYSDFLSRDVNGRICFYNASSFDELGGIRDMGLEGSEIIWDGQTVHFSLPGRHNLANALTALAIARELKISPASVKSGLESVQPLFGRSEILRGSVTVIRDCYNANPESLRRALEFCDSLEWPGRKVYVIGDMLELGAESRQAHTQMGRLLSLSDADAVFLFGTETQAAARILAAEENAPEENAPAAVPADASVGQSKLRLHTADMDQLSASLCAFLKPGDLVLLKASRGLSLERLCELPILKTGRAAPAGGKACS